MKTVVKLTQMKKPDDLETWRNRVNRVCILQQQLGGLIRLASVNHSTGKGGFLKRKKHGNRKKLH